MHEESHAQGIGNLLAHQRFRQVAKDGLAGCGALAGIEGDEKDAALHALNELAGRDILARAVVFGHFRDVGRRDVLISRRRHFQ